MNQEKFDEINEKFMKFAEKFCDEMNLEIDIDHEGDEDERFHDIDYIICIENSSTALLRLVQFRNAINNSWDLAVYEFLEEQVADQMAEGLHYLCVDFYISLKNDYEVNNYVD